MPNVSSALGRPDLSILLEDFDLEMDRLGFVGLKVFPRFDVAKISANAQRIKLASLLENRKTTRGADGSYASADFQFEQWHYQCVENGIKFPVDQAKREIFSNYFDAEVVATQLAYDAILRNQEQRIAAALFNTTTFATLQTFTAGVPDSVAGANTFVAGKYTQGSSNAVPWTTFATCTPILDVKLACELVYANSGLWPDAIVISKKLFRNLKQCAQIIDRIKYTKDPDTMSTADLANAFDLQDVFVAGGSKNTADAGQTGIAAQIWDPTLAMVCKVARKQSSPWDPGIGRTFYWTGDGGEVVETYRDEDKRADVVRVRHQTHENLMYDAAGCLITGCAA